MGLLLLQLANVSKKSRNLSDGRLRDSWARMRKWLQCASSSSTVTSIGTITPVRETLFVAAAFDDLGDISNGIAGRGIVLAVHENEGPHRALSSPAVQVEPLERTSARVSVWTSWCAPQG